MNKVAKRNKDAKFYRYYRKVNRKPNGGSWFSANKVSQYASRQYTKAIRQATKQEIKQWM
jgi:hypothetical protein